MKNLILSCLLFTASVCVSQSPKPDLAALPSTEEVSLTLKGLTLENKISQRYGKEFPVAHYYQALGDGDPQARGC